MCEEKGGSIQERNKFTSKSKSVLEESGHSRLDHRHPSFPGFGTPFEQIHVLVFFPSLLQI